MPVNPRMRDKNNKIFDYAVKGVDGEFDTIEKAIKAAKKAGFSDADLAKKLNPIIKRKRVQPWQKKKGLVKSTRKLWK